VGRIDPAPPSPRRGLGAPAGWIVAGFLAAVLVALVAFEIGKRSHVDRQVPAAVSAVLLPAAPPAPPSSPAPASTERQVPASAAPQEGRVESAVMEVTLPPRPTVPEAVSAPTVGPSPVPAETLHDKMARCLSFQAEDDEIHGVLMPTATRLRVIVTNNCDFSFAGSEVWFEARAIPNRGGGTSAREVGRFQTPIEARSRAETAIVLSCPRCYAASHTLEASLWWASGGGRRE
jgi:hypothetical protein